MGVKKADLAMLFPYEVRRLLKSYDVATLSWNNPDDRYAIVREVLTRGDDVAHEWLFETLTMGEVRALVLQYGAAGVAEPGRAMMRQRLGLSVESLPTRPYLAGGNVDGGRI